MGNLLLQIVNKPCSTCVVTKKRQCRHIKIFSETWLTENLENK